MEKRFIAMAPMARWLLATSLCALQVGCGCNDVGCGDSLTVQTAPSAARVELLFNGAVVICDEQSAAEGTCSVISLDNRTEFSFYAKTPDMLQVRVIADDGSVLREASLQPDYEESMPNGEGCPPTCREAVVQL